MNINDIKAKAKVLGIALGKLKKTELILAIQKAENNTPCFGTGTAACPYINCCWRKDCIG
ncbi:MAG: SAP domain-containing protein [bacterium]